MGHRASILYVSTDEQGNTHRTHTYSQWGASEGRLKFGDDYDGGHNGITKDDPVAADDRNDGQEVRILESNEITVQDIVGTFDVEDDEELVKFDSTSEWKEFVKDDVHLEAGYVVDTRGDEWDVTAYDCQGRFNNPMLVEVESREQMTV